MAKSARRKKEEGWTLKLDDMEAGCLYDLLLCHVAGPLTQGNEPLSRIRVALEVSGVVQVMARNVNADPGQVKMSYAVLYPN